MKTKPLAPPTRVSSRDLGADDENKSDEGAPTVVEKIEAYIVMRFHTIGGSVTADIYILYIRAINRVDGTTRRQRPSYIIQSLRDGRRKRHVRGHDVRVRGRTAAAQVVGRDPVAGRRGPVVRVRQDNGRRAALGRAERAQTVVQTLLRVLVGPGRGRGPGAVGRVRGRRPVARGRGVVPPAAVGPGPAAGTVVQRGRRVRGRRHVRVAVRQADVRDLPGERVLRHGRRPVVLRVRLHALRGRRRHRAGRGAGRRRIGGTVGRVGARPVGRGPRGVRLGVLSTVAGQRGAGRGPETRRPGGHARARPAHRRPVRPGVQPADVHRGGHVRRLVRRPVGRIGVEVRDRVCLGQSVRDSAHQPPVV